MTLAVLYMVLSRCDEGRNILQKSSWKIAGT